MANTGLRFMDEHFGPVAMKRAGLMAIMCRHCHYIHLDPLPSKQDLANLYKTEYYQGANSGQFRKEAREFWYWRKVYGARLDRFERLYERPRLDTLVLDYGAGCGWFVKAAKGRLGYHVRGVEPNIDAGIYANKHLGIGLWRQSVDLPELWQLIHASLVLEHVRDPRALLSQFYRWLRPGGMVCIVVPQEFTIDQEKLKEWWYTPLSKYHVNYFTSVSMMGLLLEAGFTIKHVAGTFPMERLALAGLNYVKHPKLGKLAHWLRMAIEGTALTVAPGRWELKRADWGSRHIGREVEIWAMK